MLDQNIVAGMEAAVDDMYRTLDMAVHEVWPHAKVNRSVFRRDDRISIDLSVLHTAAGDAIEIACELQVTEGKVWCEATMYMGQDTFMCLTSACWDEPVPTTEELAKTISDFAAVITPRFMSALSVVGAREGVQGR
jgi:hypothetical protein